MRLKRVKFRELRGGANDPSLKDACGLAPLPDRTEVVKYLCSAPPFIASPGVEGDVLDPSVRVAGPLHILTDGEWAWPAVLAYYVQKYNIGLPQDFLDHIRARNYVPPEEIDYESISLEP
jgi:hypothetical protein